MKLVTRDTDYAVRALMYLAKRPGVLISTAELNSALDLPRPFMRKLLQILQKEGFLISVKGNKGGFRLAVDPGDIFLLDLMTVFQGEFRMTECLLQKKVCPDVKTCPIRKKIKNIEKHVKGELEGVTLKSLLEG